MKIPPVDMRRLSGRHRRTTKARMAVHSRRLPMDHVAAGSVDSIVISLARNRSRRRRSIIWGRHRTPATHSRKRQKRQSSDSNKQSFHTNDLIRQLKFGTVRPRKRILSRRRSHISGDTKMPIQFRNKLKLFPLQLPRTSAKPDGDENANGSFEAPCMLKN